MRKCALGDRQLKIKRWIASGLYVALHVQITFEMTRLTTAGLHVSVPYHVEQLKWEWLSQASPRSSPVILRHELVAVNMPLELKHYSPNQPPTNGVAKYCSGCSGLQLT